MAEAEEFFRELRERDPAEYERIRNLRDGLRTARFTVASLHSSQALEHAWVVHDPDNLLEVVKERIAEHSRTAHSD